MDNSQPMAIFSNSAGLYMLFAKNYVLEENLIEKDPRPKSHELILYFLDHQKKLIKKINTVVSTPKKKYQQDLGMEFLDSDNEHFYLASKEIDAEEKAIMQTVYKVNLEGKIVFEKNFDFYLEHLPSVSTCYRRFEGKFSHLKVQGKFEEKGKTAKNAFYESAYGGIRLDIKNGFLYAYGLQHEPNNETTEENYVLMKPTHYYIQKFNLATAELIKTQSGKLPMTKDDMAKKALLQYSPAHLHFNPIDSSMVTFTIFTGNKMLVVSTNFNQIKTHERLVNPNSTANTYYFYYLFYTDIFHGQIPFYFNKNSHPEALKEYYQPYEGLNQFPKHMQCVYTGDRYITILDKGKKIETRVFPIGRK